LEDIANIDKQDSSNKPTVEIESLEEKRSLETDLIDNDNMLTLTSGSESNIE